VFVLFIFSLISLATSLKPGRVSLDPAAMEDGISQLPSADEPVSRTSSARPSLDFNSKAAGDDGDVEPPASVSEKQLPTDEPTFLSRLALPLGLLVFGAITGGTTYAVVARVNNLVANAAVDGDIETWKQTARNTAYDACYFGCNGCNDPSYAYNACQLTARAVVKGVICDGNKMWNWAAEDRYPESCLAAVGQLLMGDELDTVKQGYRRQLALITLTVLGGILGGVIAYFLWRRLTMSKAKREGHKSSPWAALRSKTWRKTEPTNRHSQHTTSSRSSSSRPASPSRSQTRLSTIATASVVSVASLASGASAYACTGYAPAQTTYFTSANRTNTIISGAVHGWISDCHDRKVCTRQRCTTSCTTGSNGRQSCTKKCTEQCRTETDVVKAAREYVDAVVPRVRECGFEVVNAVNRGWGGMERVGNARLERDWWVTVEVSGFNVTRQGETDERVWCLWRIGDSSSSPF
jgi:hypothetical protein